MRRFNRHLFTVCSAVSVALFIAVCVLWVRGSRTAHVLRWEGTTRGSERPIVMGTWSGCAAVGRFGIVVDRYVSVQQAGSEAGDRVLARWSGLLTPDDFERPPLVTTSCRAR